MALFFGVNIGLAETADAKMPVRKTEMKQPSRLIRWLFRKRQARFG
jgi:hypothetical protein